MKKLSILVMLIVCVTVGGVYATWNYAQGKATDQTKYLDDSTVITDKVVSTAKGTISVDTSGLTVKIDDTNNDYTGELLIEGKIVVTFKANAGVSADVSNNGIKMQYALSTTDNFQYVGNDIFNVDSTVQKLDAATKSFEIDAATLEQLIKLNTLTLATAEEYDAFKTALHSGAISITVSEVTE